MPRRNRVRIVVDTNVVVSGIIFPESHPGRVLTLAKDQCQALCSRRTADELFEVITRSKFDRWTVLEDRITAAKRFVELCGLVEQGARIQVCRDESDNRLLEVATVGRAAYLISGDLDLLGLIEVNDIQIVAPRAFCEILAEQAGSG